MENPKKYGKAPFEIAVIHGGPGAGGEMAPVARELSKKYGVLEPIQTALLIQGQVEELKDVLEKNANLPVTLVGYSWGGWLSFIFAASYPESVKKIILVSSGPFEQAYTAGIREKRFSRLKPNEADEVNFLLKALENPIVLDKNKVFGRIGTLMSKADNFDPIGEEPGGLIVRADIYKSVWKEAGQMRKTGELLKVAEKVKCPVTAIHGDYDPHPAEGVEKPLSAVLKDFKFILLKNCGHMPWIEKQAKNEFFRVLNKEFLPEQPEGKQGNLF